MLKNKDKICVLGMGYVGLSLSLTLAEAGFEVIGVDISEQIVKQLNKGKSNFFERGLDRFLKKNVGKRLIFSNTIPNKECNYYIICVGTPIEQVTKKPNFEYLKRVTLDIAKHLKKGDTVILRSTVPVGISRQSVLHLLEESSSLKAGKDFYFVFAPERTVEGRALLENKIIPQIIGPLNKESFKRAAYLFRRFNKNILMLPDMEHAEMLKVIDNTFRDVIFAYSNQIALICEKLALNMHTILAAVNKDYERNLIPSPSPGVGGACLTKDPYILMDLCRDLGVTHQLIEAGRKINEMMPIHLGKKLVSKMDTLGKKMHGAKIFIMGFAFKGNPETSDMRFSITLDFLRYIKKFACDIYGYDPVAYRDEIKKYGVKVCSVKEGFQKADAIIVMNNHPSFKKIKLKKLIHTTNKPCIFFDCWNLFSKTDIIKDKSVVYGGIGVY